MHAVRCAWQCAAEHAVRCVRRCAAEDSRLVGCDTVLLGEWLPMFWGNVLPLCSGSGGPRMVLPGPLDPQKE